MKTKTECLAAIMAIFWITLCIATEIIPRQEALQMQRSPDAMPPLIEAAHESVLGTYKQYGKMLFNWFGDRDELDKIERFAIELNTCIGIVRNTGGSYCPVFVSEDNVKALAVAAARAGYQVRYAGYDGTMFVGIEYDEKYTQIVIQMCKMRPADNNHFAIDCDRFDFDDVDFFEANFPANWRETDIGEHENKMNRLRYAPEHA
jgi:hypothetical protein